MSPQNLSLLPESKIEFNVASRVLEVSCPWMKLKFRVQPENSQRTEVAVSYLKFENPDQEQQSEINWLLGYLVEYPVIFPLPRHDLARCESQDQFSATLLKVTRNSIPELVAQIENEVTDAETEKFKLSWNFESILKSAYIEHDAYDPATIYALCRKLRLHSEKDASSNTDWYSLLGQLRQLNEGDFFSVCRLAIRQSHYVTYNCVPALKPAVASFTEASKEIESFIQEEKGHDRLVLQSLKALGVSDPTSLPLMPETKLSISMLRFAAENCPLGFACLVGIFEGTSYAAKDPMAALLEASSKPKAARGLQTHFVINRDHKHSDVGRELASKLGSVTRDHAIAAIKLSELTVQLGNQLTHKLMEKIEVRIGANHAAV